MTESSFTAETRGKLEVTSNYENRPDDDPPFIQLATENFEIDPEVSSNGATTPDSRSNVQDSKSSIKRTLSRGLSSSKRKFQDSLKLNGGTSVVPGILTQAVSNFELILSNILYS